MHSNLIQEPRAQQRDDIKLNVVGEALWNVFRQHTQLQLPAKLSINALFAFGKEQIACMEAEDPLLLQRPFAEVAEKLQEKYLEYFGIPKEAD